MKKKLVSLLLTSCLAIGLISTTALAKDETLSKQIPTSVSYTHLTLPTKA